MTGFGRDLSCGTVLSAGRVSSGRRLVAEAIVRRLVVPPGRLRKMVDSDDESEIYGLGLTELIGRRGFVGGLPDLPGRIRAELLKDDRLSDVVAEVFLEPSGAGSVNLRVIISVALHEESESFTLTLSVNDTSLSVLSIQ